MKSARFSQFVAAHFLSVIGFFCIASPIPAQPPEATPPNFKIAFIGDQGLGPNARAVLNLIKAEGAQALIHSGDFDYQDNPAAWVMQINDVLGPDFPYFACIGNHDEMRWSGANGYQQYIMTRLIRLGISWDGDLGVKSSFRYKGIFIVLVAPGSMGSSHDVYIRDKLAADNSIWSICSWYKNMRLMQVGGKTDETGWPVYEEARKGGAIVATAHEHSYSRTHLLSSCQNQTVASTSDTLVLTKDNTSTTNIDESRTFVFVSGLGGESIRDQERCLPSVPPYGCKGEWASIYTSTQGANYGALFGTFNVNGVPNLATFYFKDIDGVVADSFVVISNVEDNVTTVDDATGAVVSEYMLEQNYPNPLNPLNPSTTICFRLPKPARIKLTISNLLGQPVRTLFDGDINAGEQAIQWDGRDDTGLKVPSGTYMCRLESGGQVLTRKLMLLH